VRHLAVLLAERVGVVDSRLLSSGAKDDRAPALAVGRLERGELAECAATEDSISHLQRPLDLRRRVELYATRVRLARRAQAALSLAVLEAHALRDGLELRVALGGHHAPQQHAVLEALLLGAAVLGHVERVRDPVDDVRVELSFLRLGSKDERFELVLCTGQTSGWGCGGQGT